MLDLAAVVKAYDIRGTVPDQLDETVLRAVGGAFVRMLAERGDAPPEVVVGHDMRPSSPGLAAALAEGVSGQGVDVVDVGLVSTDQLYYACGALGRPGAVVTASHNPARYNGVKLCRAGAAPVGVDSGLARVRELAEAGVPAAGPPGRVRALDTLDAYADHLRGLVDVPSGRRLTVVVDAGNGMAGLTAPAVLSRLDVELVPLYFELDGSFPHHEANPIDPATLVDLQAAVRAHRADVGLAFDGDADRCFVVDERGELVPPSTLTALIAVRMLAREPGATVIHSLITSRAVPELVTEHGGVPVRSRVGHSYIKQTMAETGAVFAGEHSGHFYFRDFWRADSGMLAALHLLAALAGHDGPLSGLLAGYRRYVGSGEVNSTVPDVAAATRAVRDAFATREGVRTDDLDGLTVTGPDWWFNLRPSNTEPLLRLNVETSDAAATAALRDEVLALVRAAPGDGAAAGTPPADPLVPSTDPGGRRAH